jgi:hypothetical protein
MSELCLESALPSYTTPSKRASTTNDATRRRATRDARVIELRAFSFRNRK